MNQEIRLKAQLAHDEACAKYAQAIQDNGYQAAVDGLSRRNVERLRLFALALLGSPFSRVTNQRWSDAARAWLLSLN